MNEIQMPPVRQRHRLVAPPTLIIEPTTYLASFDKVEVTLTYGFVRYSSRDMLNAYLRTVGESPLFRAGLLWRRPTLEVRDNWLFGGKFLFFPQDSGGPGRARIEARLTLNPTRFLVHQTADLSSLQEADPAVVLQKNPTNARLATEFSLDAQDNVLPLRRWRETRPFLPYVNTYIGKITALVDQHLALYADLQEVAEGTAAEGNYAANDLDVILERVWRDWTVDHVETYWEYSDLDALSYVHRLQHHIHAIVGEATTTPYPVPRPIPSRVPGGVRRRTRQNAITISSELGAKGVTLKVYAKEHDRIRFEIVYRGNTRQALGREASLAQVPPTLAGLSRLLDLTMHRSLERFRRVWAHLPRETPEAPPSLKLWVDFTLGLTRACGGREGLIRRLLSTLIVNQAVSDTGHAATRLAINALVGIGILMPVRPQKRTKRARFVLAPRFRSTVAVIGSRLP